MKFLRRTIVLNALYNNGVLRRTTVLDALFINGVLRRTIVLNAVIMVFNVLIKSYCEEQTSSTLLSTVKVRRTTVLYAYYIVFC